MTTTDSPRSGGVPADNAAANPVDRKSRRTRMSSEARRVQLIELGLEMVAQRPLEQVSIDAIAEVAGVSRALLFHYFESKQDFHVAIAQAQGEQLLACTSPDESLSDSGEVLRSSLSAFIDYVGARRDAYLAFLRGASSTDPAMRKVVDDTRAQMVQRILDRAPELGVENSDYTRLVVFGWIAFGEEVTISWLTEPLITRDELLQMITDSLLAITLSAPSRGTEQH